LSCSHSGNWRDPGLTGCLLRAQAQRSPRYVVVGNKAYVQDGRGRTRVLVGSHLGGERSGDWLKRGSREHLSGFLLYADACDRFSDDRGEVTCVGARPLPGFEQVRRWPCDGPLEPWSLPPDTAGPLLASGDPIPLGPEARY